MDRNTLRQLDPEQLCLHAKERTGTLSELEIVLVEQLEAALDDVEAQTKDIRREANDLEEKLDVAERRVTELEDEAAALNDDLSEARERIAQLEAESLA